MSRTCMLSTHDNPFNPFKDFDSWWSYDTEMGYNSCGRMMRMANLRPDMSPTEEDLEVERAIDEIIKLDFTDTYIKVIKS